MTGAHPAAGAPRACLRRFGGRRQPLLRLVCIPWCGAGASVYRRLAAVLPEHIELLVAQFPGREDRFGEPPLRRLDDMVAHLVPEVEQVFDRPLFLFGHSMGALVAYETARALRRRGMREPHGLIVSGHGAPALRRRPGTPWHLVDDDAFIDHLRDLGGTPDALLEDRASLRSLLPMLRADYEALDSYRYDEEEPLRCRLLACAGSSDPLVSPAGMTGWLRCTEGPGTLAWFPGDHFYLAATPSVLADGVQAWISGLDISALMQCS